MSDIPPSVRIDVTKRLYAAADALDWELLPSGKKNKQYTSWIEDSDIGGVLTKYLPEGDARVWIKDVPMKEFSRAREGIGTYADYIPRRYAGPAELIHRALGPDWNLVPESVREKPLHCLTTDGSTVRYLCWGRPNTFRDLIWAAVNHAVAKGGRPLVVVALLEHTGLSTQERSKHEAIAAHCGLDLKHIERRLEPTF